MPRITALRILLLVSVSIISFIALVMPLALRPTALPLKAGEVAPRDLPAPRAIEYVSEVRTEEARQAASRAVAPIYAPPDPTIARRQVETLQGTLQYINLVRADSYATPEQKQADLAALSAAQLTPEEINFLLSLAQPAWDNLQQETASVLEQVMRNTIREDELGTFRHSLPSLVNLTLSAQQTQLVIELASPFVAPNSLYSQELTDNARQAAREAVQPVVQTYKKGEMIVQGGEIISPVEIEALQLLGMIRSKPRLEDYLGAGALVMLSGTFTWLYFIRRRLSFLNNERGLVLIAVAFSLFLIGARLIIPNRTIMPYLYPLPAFGLLLTTLFGMESGLIFSILIGILAAYGLPNTLDLTPYYLMASLCGVMALGQARRVWAFFRAGVAITMAGAAMILAYRLPSTPTDWIGLTTLAGAAAFNGIASASLSLLLQFFLAQNLGLATTLQLLEISRPDFPLLQFFLRNAPGTYQHSLQVANLAEQAAENIGADALLTRVGALFHDVGKAMNPPFFIENQPPGNIDPHNNLDPAKAAATIIRHVSDGVALARKYRLPQRIDDFILEHHGALIARYQYNHALEAAKGNVKKVDTEKFRYPGPKPRSRETALLMLADAAEARARAERPKNDDELRALIRNVIERAQQEGQLDHTQLTLRDLRTITESFLTTLRGTYHPRIQYPRDKNDKATENVRTKPIQPARQK